MPDAPDEMGPTIDDACHLTELRVEERAQQLVKQGPTPGQQIADKVAAVVGSWRFIIIQTVVLAAWMILNLISLIHHWDPYPFILLNLALSFQAAYSAPIIMMSQNRQSDIDRRHAEEDARTNVKADVEIELLHCKIDLMRQQELLTLTNAVERLTKQLETERRQA